MSQLDRWLTFVSRMERRYEMTSVQMLRDVALRGRPLTMEIKRWLETEEKADDARHE